MNTTDATPQSPPATGTQVLRIAAVTRKPDSASFAQRVLGYLPHLADMGIGVTPIALPGGFFAQRRCLALLSEFDAVWWHRHLLSAAHLPLLRRNARRLVYDFDDPVYYSSQDGGQPSSTRRRRFARFLTACDAALPASDYLRQLAEPYCALAPIMPMAIDTPGDASADRPDSGAIELLWLGSRSTQSYLELIRPVLEQIGESHTGVKLRLVAHEPMTFGKLPVDFRPWSPAEQDRALRACHIGLCPMPDTVWTRGKCPFKVIQYMAFGLPWVGSAVGENITSAGRGDAARGVCAADTTQWPTAITQLIGDRSMRRAMGEAGIAYVASHHERSMLAGELAQFWRQIGDMTR